MPIDSKHLQYTRRIKEWTRARDVTAGSDSVKAADTTYLPRLEGQDQDQYESYKQRALFLNATNRTIQGLLGAVFRDPLIVEGVDEKIERDLEDVTRSGVSLPGFAQDLLREILTLGRSGILIDVPQAENGATAPMPYWALYKGEDIVNWRTTRFNGEQVLVMCVLREMIETPTDEDPFDMKETEQYRLLALLDGVYHQQLWTRPEEDAKFVPGPLITPTRRGRTLDRIPFVFMNSHDLSADTDKPPLIDLIDVNLSHYRTSADLEHGAHFTGLPTAWVAGFPADKTLRIGAQTAWVTENVAARAGYLEFTGQGLGALSELKKDKELQMAVLGARMLEETKRTTEAAETLKIRQSGESGALAAMVKSENQALTRALRLYVWWVGSAPELDTAIQITLSTDFFGGRLGPEEVREMVAAWQLGAISTDTMLYQFKQGEILPPNITTEEERARVANEGPPNPMLEAT